MDIETSGIQPIPAGWRYQVIGSIWHILQHYSRCRFETDLRQRYHQTELYFQLELGEDLAVCQKHFFQYKTGRSAAGPWTVSKVAKEVLYHFAKNWMLSDRIGVEFHFVTDRLSDGFLAVQQYTEHLRGNRKLACITIQSPHDSRRAITADEFAGELANLFNSLGARDHHLPVLSAGEAAEFMRSVYIEEPLTEEAAITDGVRILRRFVPLNIAESRVKELFDETFRRLCSGSGEFTAADLLSSVGITGPISWDRIKEFADLHREDRIRGIVDRRGLLDPSRAVSRADAEAAFSRFLQSDRPVLLLSGPQGTGKTTVQIRLAREYADSHASMIFSMGDLSISSVITSRLLEHLDYQPDLMTLPQILRRADQGTGAGMKLLIFGDGADEVDLDGWRVVLNDIAFMMAGDQALPIKFCFSIRHEAWHAGIEDLLSEYRRLFYVEQASGSDSLGSLSVSLGDFGEQEFDQALQEWRVEADALGPWRDLLRAPRYFGIYVRLSDEARESVLAAPPRPATLLEAYLKDRLREVARHASWNENDLRLDLIELCSVFETQLSRWSEINIDEFRTSSIATKWSFPRRSRDQVYGAMLNSGLILEDEDIIHILPDDIVPYLLAAAAVGRLVHLTDGEERRQQSVELVGKLDSATDDADYWCVALLVQILEGKPNLKNEYIAVVEALLQRWQLASFFRTVGPAAVRAIGELSRQGDGGHWPAYSQAAALVAVGALPEVVTELLRRLDEGSDDERIQACRALACLRVSEAIVPIAKHFKTFGDIRDDHTVTECLSRYGEEALDALHRLAGGESRDMVHCAAYALSRIAHKASMSVLRQLARRYGDHNDILSAALWGLARMADGESADLFRQAIGSNHEIVARSGILGLRMTRDRDGASLLIDFVQDRRATANPFLKSEAVSAIADIGDEKGLEALIGLLRADLGSNEPLFGEREWAWYANRLPAPDSSRLLLQVISDGNRWGKDDWRRREAIQMLAEDKRTAVTYQLRQIASADDPLWTEAQDALLRVVETAHLRSGPWRDSESDEREQACIVLMKAGATSAADALTTLLGGSADDVYLAVFAAEWLRVYGDQVVAGELMRIYEALPTGDDTNRIYSALKQDIAQALGTCGTSDTLQNVLGKLLTEKDGIALYGLVQAAGELAVAHKAHDVIFDKMIELADNEEHLHMVNEAIKHTAEFVPASFWRETAIRYPRRDELEEKLLERLERGSSAAMLSVAICGLSQHAARLHRAIEAGDDKQVRSALDGVLWLDDKAACESLTRRIHTEIDSGRVTSSDDLISYILAVASALGCDVDLADCLAKGAGWLHRGRLLQAALKAGVDDLKNQAAAQLLSDHQRSWVDGTVSQAIRELGEACPEALAGISSSSDYLRTWPDQYLSSLAEAWLHSGQDDNAAKAVEMLTRVSSKHASRSIAIAISRSESDHALKLLLDLSASPSPHIRTLAAEALAWQSESGVIDRLAGLAGDESSEVRLAARSSLELIDQCARQREYLRSVDWSGNLSALGACNTLATSMDDLVAHDLLPALFGESTPVSFARAEHLFKHYRKAQEQRERDERNVDQRRDWFQLGRIKMIAGGDEEIVTIGSGQLVDEQGQSHPVDYSIAVRPAGPIGRGEWRGVVQTLDEGIAFGGAMVEATLVLSDGRKGRVLITNSSFASWRDGDMIEFRGQGKAPS